MATGTNGRDPPSINPVRRLASQFRDIARLRPQRMPGALLSLAGTLLELRSRKLEPARIPLATEGEFLRWSNPASPAVSVVVPVFNQIGITVDCLRSVIGAAADAISLELIIVDDASTDAEVGRLRVHPGIKYHRNPANVGFVGSSNVGASLATGRYLVFLNSDVLVTRGWLKSLLTRLEEPGIGLAGARLQYPDGRLQEAGGVVFADGSAWNYGRDGHPDDPRYLTCRDAHYCSGAVLALPRERFEQMGGFDPLFAPGYYEDTDLAMRVRASGARVVYEPDCVVVHLEGMSAGRDGSSGMKAAQAVNRERFLARWLEALQGDHPSAGTDVDLAVRTGGAGWIVACAGAGEDEAFLEVLETLARKGFAVDLFLLDGIPAGRVRRLRGRGVYVWTAPWHATGRWLLLRHGSAVHATVSDGSVVSRRWFRRVRSDLTSARHLHWAPDGSTTQGAEQRSAAVFDVDGVLRRLGG